MTGIGSYYMVSQTPSEGRVLPPSIRHFLRCVLLDHDGVGKAASVIGS